jgi:fucose permease
MKRKMIDYMINREISPMEFANMVDLNSKATPSFTKENSMKTTSLFDTLLGVAIIAVGIFLFFTSYSMQSIGKENLTENIFVLSGESLGLVLCVIGSIFLYKLKR